MLPGTSRSIINGQRWSIADNGPPGDRDYHPGYYGAYVLDPDGTNVEAVHHGPVERSADSVVFTWEST